MGKRGPRGRHSHASALHGTTAPNVDSEKAVAAARKRIPGKAGRAFFDAVEAEFAGWSAAELELLVRAAQATDRIEEARTAIEREGITIEGARGGQVRHPALAVEKAALAELRAFLKALRLEEVAR